MSIELHTKESLTWRDHSLCLEPQSDPYNEEIFMEYSGKQEKAKRTCAVCPVLQNCIEFGLSEPGLALHMVVGGMERSVRLRESLA